MSETAHANDSRKESAGATVAKEGDDHRTQKAGIFGFITAAVYGIGRWIRELFT